MSALSIRLPNSLHERVRELAAHEGISINQLVATALAEKMAALMTADYLEARARRGSWAKFLAALARVPMWNPIRGIVWMMGRLTSAGSRRGCGAEELWGRPGMVRAVAS